MHSTQPLISVVLPTHDRAELLERAITSALGQTYKDLEVIVVENACTDGTAALLDRLTDKRLRRLRLDRKCGASAARNAALRIANGKLVAFLDDDDFWFPTKLAQQAQALAAAPDRVGLCLCGYLRLLPRDVVPYFSRYYFEQVDFSYGVSLRNFAVVATPGWLVRREVLDRAGGFDESLPARNDWELALRLRDICDFVFLDEPLYCQDQTRTTTMAFNGAALVSALRRIDMVHGHRWADRPEVGAMHARVIGRYELSTGNTKEGRRWLWRALRLQPLRLRTLALCAASVLWPTAFRPVNAMYQHAWRRSAEVRR